jgi:pyruvate,water dikinase
MTTAPAPSELSWDSPGPGTWTLDPVHHPRPVTQYWVEMHPEPFMRGISEFMRFYGLLIDRLEIAYVNGFAYHATRLVPDEEVPQRFARAEEVFAGKVWREQLPWPSWPFPSD